MVVLMAINQHYCISSLLLVSWWVLFWGFFFSFRESVCLWQEERESVWVCVSLGVCLLSWVSARASCVVRVRERARGREFASRDKTKKTTILLYYYWLLVYVIFFHIIIITPLYGNFNFPTFAKIWAYVCVCVFLIIFFFKLVGRKKGKCALRKVLRIFIFFKNYLGEGGSGKMGPNPPSPYEGKTI
jgi:hypothetical protein